MTILAYKLQLKGVQCSHKFNVCTMYLTNNNVTNILTKETHTNIILILSYCYWATQTTTSSAER